MPADRSAEVQDLYKLMAERRDIHEILNPILMIESLDALAERDPDTFTELYDQMFEIAAEFPPEEFNP